MGAVVRERDFLKRNLSQVALKEWSRRSEENRGHIAPAPTHSRRRRRRRRRPPLPNRPPRSSITALETRKFHPRSFLRGPARARSTTVRSNQGGISFGEEGGAIALLRHNDGPDCGRQWRRRSGRSRSRDKKCADVMLLSLPWKCFMNQLSLFAWVFVTEQAARGEFASQMNLRLIYLSTRRKKTGLRIAF